jgi:hypothetical protein
VLTLEGTAEAPAAFGYVLVPGDEEVRLALASDDQGISLQGHVGSMPVDARSERCTFSS